MDRTRVCVTALAAVGLLSGLSALPASAQITRADFGESLDLPDFSAAGPRVLENLDVALPSAGPQLTAANTVSNPSNWNNVLNVSFDATTNILTLTGDGNNDYQTITVTLSDLQFALPGQVITGITPISTGNAVTPGSAVPTITPSFTANSFSVNYAVPLGNNFDFNITPASDTYQVTLGSAPAAAPEPGTIALLGVGLGVMGVVARRRNARR